MISSEKSIFTKDMSGFVELTELSDSHAKGKLVYTEKGDIKLTVEFDILIEQDMLKK